MHDPSYLDLHARGLLPGRIDAARSLLSPCVLCPRRCGADRNAGEEGVCRTGRLAKVAAVQAHFGEERPLVGRGGSGTLFIGSCNLLCAFCQNAEISHGNGGEPATPEEMASMMLHLQHRGCRNVNIVTPTHAVPQILEALPSAIAGGLRIPLVYNCGGYERIETLRLLEGVFDLYMPDFKFWDDAWGERFCGVPDYAERTREAIREMHRQVGDLEIDISGEAVRGLLVRHLVMPGGIAGTAGVMAFLASLSRRTYVNVMDQYRPCGADLRDPLINRRITAGEYTAAVSFARQAGLYRIDR